MSSFPKTLRPDGLVGDELFDGVMIERRHFLSVSLGMLSATVLNRCPRALAQQTNAPLSWDDLIARVMPLSEALTESASPDEEGHLIELSGLIERLSPIPRSFMSLTEPVAMHESLRRFPLLVVQFRLAPGATIPYHDHRDYNGVLTVTEGSIRIRSFEVLGRDQRPPQGHTFQIRQTGDSVLAKGEQSTLSRTRDNIHDLRAGSDGARFIDFFTLFDEDARSTYLNVADQPRHSAQRVFDANWA